MSKKIIITSVLVALCAIVFGLYFFLKPYQTFSTQEECQRVQQSPCHEYDYKSWALPPKHPPQ
jgi:hypothetical protein